MSKSSLIGSFILGTIVGAVVIAFTTPYSGDRMRTELARQYDKRMQDTQELSHSLLSQYRTNVFCFVDILRSGISKFYDKMDAMTSGGVGVLMEDEIL